MFGFIVGAITGGLVMWYRNRTTEFAADHMIGMRNDETVPSGSDASETEIGQRPPGVMNPRRPSRSTSPMIDG
jgi:hypothetical protein